MAVFLVFGLVHPAALVGGCGDFVVDDGGYDLLAVFVFCCHGGDRAATYKHERNECHGCEGAGVCLLRGVWMSSWQGFAAPELAGSWPVIQDSS